MKSILKEIYKGNLYPQEDIVPKDPEYRLESKKVNEKLERLQKKLSKSNYNRVEKIIDLYMDISVRDSEQSFMSGFELGAMLMIQVFMNEGSLIRE